MAALMVQEQKAREGDPITCDDVPIQNRFTNEIHAPAGDLKLVDGASRGGIEELRARADSIAKIAKKISGLQLGDRQVPCFVKRAATSVSETLFHSIFLQEGDSTVQKLLQLGFIDPVTSASAGKRCASKQPSQPSACDVPLDISKNWLCKSARKWAKKCASSEALYLSLTCAFLAQ